MQISSQETFVGESVTLNLQIENTKTTEAPKFPPVDGLTIDSTGIPQQQTMTTFVNGRRRERKTLTYSYQITATNAGEFAVPGIKIETETGGIYNQAIHNLSKA